jgi:arabinose-5-phosphate isomerase
MTSRTTKALSPEPRPASTAGVAERAPTTDLGLLQRGKTVLAIESRALAALAENPPSDFAAACRLCLACRGRVIVTGMGKSGHIGHKIAATLASTGTPSFFIHPAEAGHGDLGMLVEGDLVLAISYSGETEEILAMLPRIKRLGLPLIALTGSPRSRLAQASDAILEASVEQEACSLNLAPTASTTIALALGDALAVALLDARGFTEEDFAHAHPSGRLGRRLWLRVSDLMHRGDGIPSVRPETRISQALIEMTRKGLGMTAITTPEGTLLGVFTDGDLRRVLDRRLDIHDCLIDTVMTPDPKTIPAEALAAEALKLMEQYRINALLATTPSGKLVGALNMHDLLRAGVV